MHVRLGWMACRCVPYRVNKKDDEEVVGSPCSSSLGDDTGTAEVEVLMISTPNRADMVFPKVRIGGVRS
jgi:diphosphoinositol-polyphosphate diphosphatase